MFKRTLIGLLILLGSSSALVAQSTPAPSGRRAAALARRVVPPASKSLRPTTSNPIPATQHTQNTTLRFVPPPPPPSATQSFRIIPPKVAPPAAPVAVTPAPAAVPLAPAAPPANSDEAIKVEFQKGLLTVVADNAELGKVLHAIAARTGADVDVAPELSKEPVAAHLGPGSPNEVLAALLNGPRIDFIIMGSDEDGRVQRLVVRKKATFNRESSVAMTSPRQRFQAMPATRNEAVETPRQAEEPAPAQNGGPETQGNAAPRATPPLQ